MVHTAYFRTSLPRYKETLNLIWSYFNKDEQLHILDFGTGEGDMAVFIKQHFPQHHVVAADILISQAVKEKLVGAGVDLFQRKIKLEQNQRLSIESNCFDVILFLEVLEHVLADPVHIFSEINRILKIGGYLFLTTPNIAQLFNRVMLLFGKQPQLYLSSLRYGHKLGRGHFREWTMDELLYLLSHTFRIEKHAYLTSMGTGGLVKERKLYRILYYPYRLLCIMKPSFRNTIAIICQKVS